MMRVIVCFLFLLTMAGCGTKAAIRADWKTRAPHNIPTLKPGCDVPLYVTAEDFECKRDGTRLQELVLSGSPHTYQGVKQETAWYCPKEDVYWIFYQQGRGGSLGIQWFGPFDVPKKKSKRATDKEIQTGNRGFLL